MVVLGILLSNCQNVVHLHDIYHYTVCTVWTTKYYNIIICCIVYVHVYK